MAALCRQGNRPAELAEMRLQRYGGKRDRATRSMRKSGSASETAAISGNIWRPRRPPVPESQDTRRKEPDRACQRSLARSSSGLKGSTLGGAARLGRRQRQVMPTLQSLPKGIARSQSGGNRSFAGPRRGDRVAPKSPIRASKVGWTGDQIVAAARTAVATWAMQRRNPLTINVQAQPAVRTHSAGLTGHHPGCSLPALS